MRALRVRVKGRPVATLRETDGGGATLRYDAGATTAAAIGLSLPVKNFHHAVNPQAPPVALADITNHLAAQIGRGAGFRAPFGVPPFFQHLTAEGRLRGGQAAAAALDPQDDFGLLAAFGGDCLGAVSVQPMEETEHQLAFDFLPAPSPPHHAPPRDGQGLRTISGVQDKFLATYDAQGRVIPAGLRGPAPIIAKIATQSLPDIVPLEAFTLDLARLLLGDDQVTKARLGFVEGQDAAALLVERFDRTPDNQPLRMEDFCQILARPRGVDFSGKYNGGFEEIFAALHLYSADPIPDVVQLFTRILTFALLGNCDCHLKNFAMLERPEGMRLSPAYDVVATAIYAQNHFTTRFGLRLSGRERLWAEIDHQEITRLGLRVGLTADQIEARFEQMRARWPAVMRHAAPSDSAPDWRHRLWAVLNEAESRLLTP